jgi:hypothetical protein
MSNTPHTTKPADGYCQEFVTGKRNMGVGVGSRGHDSFTADLHWCRNQVVEGESYCQKHLDLNAKFQLKLIGKRQAEQNRRGATK